MEVLEDMERQQKVLVDENAALRRKNETIASEVTRLSAILAAREQVRHVIRRTGRDPLLLKGFDAMRTFVPKSQVASRVDPFGVCAVLQLHKRFKVLDMAL